MRHFFVAFILLFIFSNCKDTSVRQNKEITIVELDKYPVFPDCNADTTNIYMLKCLSSKLAFFYYSNLTDIYIDSIGNIKDTITMSLEIDTAGITHLNKVKHYNNKNRNIDSVLKDITKKIPYISPAEFKGKKVFFKFNLPIIFEENNIENE